MTDTEATGAATGPGASQAPGGAVRPYVITGGRTEVDPARVRIETMVLSVAAPDAVAELTFERYGAVELCVTALSVAELSAKLAIPIGVVRVLVSDLEAEGLVILSEPTDESSSDIAFLQRLIDGVRTL